MKAPPATKAKAKKTAAAAPAKASAKGSAKASAKAPAAKAAAKAAPAKKAAAKSAPAKAPAKTAAARPETITLNQMAKALAEATEMPRKQTTELLAEMTSMIQENLKKGVRVRIGGLGVLQVRKRPARMGRNPATGEPIKIKASKKVAFRPAKELKELL